MERKIRRFEHLRKCCRKALPIYGANGLGNCCSREALSYRFTDSMSYCRMDLRTFTLSHAKGKNLPVVISGKWKRRRAGVESCPPFLTDKSLFVLNDDWSHRPRRSGSSLDQPFAKDRRTPCIEAERKGGYHFHVIHIYPMTVQQADIPFCFALF